MRSMRRKHDAGLGARVALEAVKGEKTIAQLSSEYGFHANQIHKWKKQLLENLSSILSDNRGSVEREHADVEAELYRQIRQLKVELYWLKKSLSNWVRGEAKVDRGEPGGDFDPATM